MQLTHVAVETQMVKYPNKREDPNLAETTKSNMNIVKITFKTRVNVANKISHKPLNI